ncbi:MAG: hypothetical protein ACYST0_00525 [Planctomycetota bacterium]|jgi:hypothetical protein
MFQFLVEVSLWVVLRVVLLDVLSTWVPVAASVGADPLWGAFFLAAAFLGWLFFAAAFVEEVFFEAAFLVELFFAGLFLAGLFLAELFFAGVFLRALFLVVICLPHADSEWAVTVRHRSSSNMSTACRPTLTLTKTRTRAMAVRPGESRLCPAAKTRCGGFFGKSVARHALGAAYA